MSWPRGPCTARRAPPIYIHPPGAPSGGKSAAGYPHASHTSRRTGRKFNAATQRFATGRHWNISNPRIVKSDMFLGRSIFGLLQNFVRFCDVCVRATFAQHLTVRHARCLLLLGKRITVHVLSNFYKTMCIGFVAVSYFLFLCSSVMASACFREQAARLRCLNSTLSPNDLMTHKSSNRLSDRL